MNIKATLYAILNGVDSKLAHDKNKSKGVSWNHVIQGDKIRKFLKKIYFKMINFKFFFKSVDV